MYKFLTNFNYIWFYFVFPIIKPNIKKSFSLAMFGSKNIWRKIQEKENKEDKQKKNVGK